jgi:hypothetical protein
MQRPFSASAAPAATVGAASGHAHASPSSAPSMPSIATSSTPSSSSISMESLSAVLRSFPSTRVSTLPNGLRVASETTPGQCMPIYICLYAVDVGVSNDAAAASSTELAHLGRLVRYGAQVKQQQ